MNHHSWSPALGLSRAVWVSGFRPFFLLGACYGPLALALNLAAQTPLFRYAFESRQSGAHFVKTYFGNRPTRDGHVCSQYRP